MNFATLKSLTIPEGNVTKITDASDKVLWSAAKPITITLKRENPYTTNVIHVWIEIGGVRYDAPETPTELTANEGSKILCHLAGGQVQINGVVVFQAPVEGAVYEYTANQNVTIGLVNAHMSDTQFLSFVNIMEES